MILLKTQNYTDTTRDFPSFFFFRLVATIFPYTTGGSESLLLIATIKDGTDHVGTAAKA